MNIKSWKLALTGLIFSAVSLTAIAQNVRILKVEQSFVPAKEESNVRRFRESRLNKFDDFRVKAGQQIFQVRWQPGHRGAEPGTEVVFNYFQARVKKMQTLRIKYPFRVSDIRTATFTISPKAFREGGAVTRWQALIVQNGRTSAQSFSSDWNKR